MLADFDERFVNLNFIVCAIMRGVLFADDFRVAGLSEVSVVSSDASY